MKKDTSQIIQVPTGCSSPDPCLGSCQSQKLVQHKSMSALLSHQFKEAQYFKTNNDMYLTSKTLFVMYNSVA